MMRVLVCGGRDYTNYERVCEVMLEAVGHLPSDQVIIIDGGARGADELAHTWAHKSNIHTARVTALWDSIGPKAGVMRNEAMLLLRPDLVIAFPGGKGTYDMVRRAENRGIMVRKVDWE